MQKSDPNVSIFLILAFANMLDSIKDESLLRINKVIERTGLKTTTIYEGMNEGTFPRNKKYNKHKRSAYWRKSHIDAWVLQTITQD